MAVVSLIVINVSIPAGAVSRPGNAKPSSGSLTQKKESTKIGINIVVSHFSSPWAAINLSV